MDKIEKAEPCGKFILIYDQDVSFSSKPTLFNNWRELLNLERKDWEDRRNFQLKDRTNEYLISLIIKHESKKFTLNKIFSQWFLEKYGNAKTWQEFKSRAKDDPIIKAFIKNQKDNLRDILGLGSKELSKDLNEKLEEDLKKGWISIRKRGLK